MRIGFFTDTYFPQVSGVATSIKTLKEELESKGHQIYIFTTTDPKVVGVEPNIIRMPSIPFISFKDRRIVVRGMYYAYTIAKELEIDIVHTHTEFGAGWLGKFVAKRMDIPAVHTYHTMYEDYLHYIAKGKLIRSSHVRQVSRTYCRHLSGIVCPSERVVQTLRNYDISVPMKTIPTGVNIKKFSHKFSQQEVEDLRKQLHVSPGQLMLLSLSRISYEKNIHGIIKEFPKVVKEEPNVRLIIAGDGPYRQNLEELVQTLELSKWVRFTGEINNDTVPLYYQAADYFISGSSSESQGLTYIESIAAGTPCIVKGNEYLNHLINKPALGRTFENDSDFSSTLLRYKEENYEDREKVREHKLKEISSASFADSILSFYNNAKEFHELQNIRERHSPIKGAIRFLKK